MADDLDDVYHLIEAFTVRAQQEFDERLKNWPTNLAEEGFHEVAGALLARQVTLAIELAACPAIWNADIAPIILRAMADVYITLAWILRDPATRCKKFIYFGLGRQKLELEHRRVELEVREALEGEIDYLDSLESWINSQRATFLTDVNLGSWSGISTRDMAEEAESLDFYNYVYVPFSSCSHSMWHHIGRYNLKQCQNPLHRFHKLPKIGDGVIDLHYLYLAAKYLQKTVAAFDQFIGTKIQGQSAFDALCDDIEIITTLPPSDT